jgi:hypothetical protein
VNELVPQGEGPVILRDEDLTTQTLQDAALEIGDSLTIPGTGITLTVLAGTGGAFADIQVAYSPPLTDYNVRITRGDTIDGDFFGYYSPDIWIDSPRGGYTLGGGPPAHEDRDDPVVGEVNRVYARIWNDGPATAFDFDVRFRISEPYHTVGGEADFDTFVGIVHVASLASGASTNVFVDWTPDDDGKAHACLMVDLINLVGTDTNPHDNWAQENLEKVTSVTASPFHPVDYRFSLTNPYEQEALFYFRAEGAPADWTVTLNPRKILLNPGERVDAIATLAPPPDAKVCSSEMVRITSWSPRGDTLINVGGAAVQVDLRRSTTLTLDADTGRCTPEQIKQLLGKLQDAKPDSREVRWAVRRLTASISLRAAERDEILRLLVELGRAALRGEGIDIGEFTQLWFTALDRHEGRDHDDLVRNCATITAVGCTNPPRPNEEIIVKFTAPDGTVEYQTVMTDANGCFETFLVTVEDGEWDVQAEYEGNDCDGPAKSRPKSVGARPCGCAPEKDEPR